MEEYLKEFRASGIQLDDAGQERLKEVNAELARLGTEFGQRVKEGMKSAALLLDDAADLAGLPADDVASAAEAARTAGHEGKFLLTLIQPSNQPAMAALENRDVRRRLYEASIGRGSGGGSLDVLDLVKDMVRLRAEKASLLGFANFAELSVDRQTAPDFQPSRTMMSRLAPAAVRNADAEAEALAEAAGHPLEAWDWAYYSAKVKRERYAVDEQALRPYFELDRVLNDGVFFAANALYGITFHERTDLAGYHPDVRVWEVKNSDGTDLGLFLGDYYTRDTKRGGAWMNSLVEQSGLLNTRPVVINNLNISKPPAGEPTLLTLDELRTTFHEFGHALHGLFSAVTYPRFSGTNVPRDFVEYPSQVNEMWIMWPEVLANYARHYATGEPCRRKPSTSSMPRSSGAKASAPPNTSARPCWTWPGTCWTAPDSRRTRSNSRQGTGRGRRRAQPDPAALPDRLLPAHLRRRLVCRRLLLLHLERSPGRRHRGVVQGKRRPQPRQRRFLPGRAAFPRQQPGPAGVLPRLPRPGRGPRPAAQAPRPGLTHSSIAPQRPLLEAVIGRVTEQSPPSGLKNDGGGSPEKGDAAPALVEKRSNATSRARRGGAAAGSRRR